MSLWLTEQEFRSDRSAAHQITLNVAFLQEIKDDNVELKTAIARIEESLSTQHLPPPRILVERLNELRDALETHFTLEEFYGYFQPARESHSQINHQAANLRQQHETIYLEVCELVDLAETILYRESPLNHRAQSAIIAGFHAFVQHFNDHEQQEMDLMMKLCNEEIGVGD